MGKGWLDKYQMGGSLPGATGMMYARTSSKEPKKAQNGTVERREIVRDNIPQQKQFNIKPLSAEYIAELKRQEQIAKTGELKAYEPQGILDKALDVTLNPVTAFGYAVRGERLPDNFDKGKRNSIDYALDVINPAQYINDAKNLVEGTVTGNLSQIGEGALGVVPLGLEAKNIYKGVKNFKPKNFKSEIDWENWVKYKEDFHNNPKVIKHLNEIEKTTKKNGTWMKNPDGSPFKGTQEEFVVQQSDNYKKAFPNPILDDAGNIQTNYHGSPNKFEVFEKNRPLTEKTGTALGEGVYTSAKRSQALEYAVRNPDKKGNLYELYINSNKPQNKVSLHEKYIDDKIEKIKKDYLNKKISKESADKLYDDVLKENEEIWKTIPDSEFKLQKDKDYLRVNNEQVTSRDNYLKSMKGNILLDMTNPNIYKTLIPGAIGLGAASQTEFKNGGSLDKYQDGGEIPIAQKGKKLKYNWLEERKKSPSFTDNFTENTEYDPNYVNYDSVSNAIKNVESLDGKLMWNPESTATGFFGQRFSEIKNDYKGTRKDFVKDTTAQKEYFKKRFYDGLKSSKTTPLLRDANDLYKEYKPQIANFNYTKEDLAVLSNFLGRGGAKKYLGYHVRDGQPLEKALPNIYGKNKKQTNKTPENYLKQARPHYQGGGVIEDDRGQWAHPGEITKINSNNITMKGVNYPVLGISNTGDEQLMMPGEDYKFDGDSVTEYPIAQNGKQLQKLDQLTNFTNYNTPQPGGWLDKYN